MKKRLSLFALRDLLKLSAPLLLYPVAYLPYKLWGIGPFANLVRRIVYGEAGNPMWTVFNAQETIIYFWLTVAAVVTVAAAVLAAIRVRPWYCIPLYLLVTISLCGVLSLVFYRLMV